MKKFYLTLPLIFLLIQCIQSQNRIFSGFNTENIDNSVYTSIHHIWFSNEKISYIAPLPYFKIIETPTIALRQGEGTKELGILEGNLYHQLPIAMGRNHGAHFYQTSRITFNYGFNERIVKDASSPTLPGNKIFGLSITKSLWNSETRCGKHYTRFAFDDWTAKEDTLWDVSMELTANHYSNGQLPGSSITDTIDGNAYRRNDYLKGDFSTNYLKLMTTVSYMYPSKSIASMSLGYQVDGDAFGPLGFHEEQKQSYGQARILSFLQYRHVQRIRRRYRCTRVENVCNNTTESRKLYYYNEYVFRLESEYILGNMSLYRPGEDKKYRFNNHLYLQFTRPNWRALGFLVHAYYGRDYSNIRYDLPIFAVMGGVSVNFNKYKPQLNSNQWGLTETCDNSQNSEKLNRRGFTNIKQKKE